MTARQEFASWMFPTVLDTRPAPHVNQQAPATGSPALAFPRNDGKPVVLAFLRHCGCPFAEKTFKQLRKLAHEHPDLHFIAVSHSDDAATTRWVDSVGGAGNVEVMVDHERKLYAQYGLGVSSLWHVLNPWSLGAVFNMARQEKIVNRPTESGNRWQTSGVFAVDASGLVRYSHPAQTSDDLGDLDAAVASCREMPKL